MKIIEYQSKNTFEETVEKVKSSIEKMGFALVSILPFNEALEKKNYSIDNKATMIEVCKAEVVKSILQINSQIAYALPCKIVIREENNKIFAGFLSLKKQFIEKVGNETIYMAEDIENGLTALIESACN